MNTKTKWSNTVDINPERALINQGKKQIYVTTASCDGCRTLFKVEKQSCQNFASS